MEEGAEELYGGEGDEGNGGGDKGVEGDEEGQDEAVEEEVEVVEDDKGSARVEATEEEVEF